MVDTIASPRSKNAKKRPNRGKKGHFRAKKGQKTRFAVTDSLTGRKIMLLIMNKLQAIWRPKKDFHREGGWGVGPF
jgi:hypothetical protein